MEISSPNLILSAESHERHDVHNSPMEISSMVHPTLDLFEVPRHEAFTKAHDENLILRSNKLYLVPTSHGETYDPDFAPNPSPLRELPNIERWTLTYVISALEALAGRRSIQQIARSTHRFTYNSLLHKVGTLKEIPKIRKFHRHQPIEGVVEITVTLVFKERIRVLAARFEGVDRKWLCTEFEIL